MYIYKYNRFYSLECFHRRGVVQKCGHTTPQMINLISLGGQHQGVYGIPNCGAVSHETCDYIRRLLNHAAYTE